VEGENGCLSRVGGMGVFLSKRINCLWIERRVQGVDDREDFFSRAAVVAAKSLVMCSKN
jgi:hypothetical protein